MARVITGTVWVLSLVSLFTDVASEMLYPVIPVYLKSIGFSMVLIGVLEGIAEAVAGLSKGYFGKLSDSSGKRLPFVRWGYALSALSKPMMGLLTSVWWVFLSRTTDRLGKGLRTAARDAMLSAEATQATKGSVFGFHRAMDTLGAVLGPCLALLYLYYNPGSYSMLFLLAFIPGAISIFFTYLLKDKSPGEQRPRPSFLEFLNYLKTAPRTYNRLIFGLLLFTLANSSDVFLLLKVRESTGDDTTAIAIYIFYNLIYALFSYPLGKLADRIGIRKVLVTGLAVFALVYILMAWASQMWVFIFAFMLYGAYAAATEGQAKAWISNICAEQETATAIGTYTALQSICTLAASSLTGIIWFRYGATPAFITSASLTVIVVIYFLLAVKSSSDK